MDSETHETPGLGLPPPSASQQSAPLPRQNPAAPVPVVADGDLDEEWVDKAKAIVDRTRNDPFLETQELSKIKAEYLSTRYNKHIKVSEDNA